MSINDVLLTATAAGPRHHLVARGGVVADLRVLVPVDLRGGEPVPPTLGNHFGVVFVGCLWERRTQGDACGSSLAAAGAPVSAEAGGTYLLLRLVGALPRLGGSRAAVLGRASARW